MREPAAGAGAYAVPLACKRSFFMPQSSKHFSSQSCHLCVHLQQLTHNATSWSVMSFLVSALIPCLLASALSSLIVRAESLSSTSAAALAGLDVLVRKGMEAVRGGREPVDVLLLALRRVHELKSDLCGKKKDWQDIKDALMRVEGREDGHEFPEDSLTIDHFRTVPQMTMPSVVSFIRCWSAAAFKKLVTVHHLSPCSRWRAHGLLSKYSTR